MNRMWYKLIKRKRKQIRENLLIFERSHILIYMRSNHKRIGAIISVIISVQGA